MKKLRLTLLVTSIILAVSACGPNEPETNNVVTATSTNLTTYPIGDTNQSSCYDATKRTNCPTIGTPFYGQDAQYTSNKPSYKDNGDGSDQRQQPSWSSNAYLVKSEFQNEPETTDLNVSAISEAELMKSFEIAAKRNISELELTKALEERYQH